MQDKHTKIVRLTQERAILGSLATTRYPGARLGHVLLSVLLSMQGRAARQIHGVADVGDGHRWSTALQRYAPASAETRKWSSAAYQSSWRR